MIKSGHSEARGFSLPKGILDWSHDVLRVDRRHSFLHIRKRIVYVFQDLGVDYPETRAGAANCSGPLAAVEDSFNSAFFMQFGSMKKKACQPGRPQGTNKNGADPPVYKTLSGTIAQDTSCDQAASATCTFTPHKPLGTVQFTQ